MSAEHCDVAVVGGGPAGCSAAISLARRGLRVVLFEARHYPHDKMCGEFLSPECGGLLEELGVSSRLASLGPVNIQSASLTAPDGTVWETKLPGTALGISRKLMDQALAEEVQRAGGILRESTTVTNIMGSLGRGFQVEMRGRNQRETITARAVIAAHGKRDTLDRMLGRRFFEQRQPFVALKAHFHGPPIPGRIELHAFPGGYCGMSEIEDGKKVVCLLAHETAFERARGPQGVDGFIHWMMGQNVFLQTWMQWAERIHERWITIAQVPFVSKPVVEGDIFMAGDSAGLIVPLAGNGISMALESGQLAAQVLEQYLEGEISAEDARNVYSRQWEQRFRQRLRLGRVLQPIMLHPRSAGLILRLLNAFPALGSYLTRSTRGKVRPVFAASNEGVSREQRGKLLF